MPRDPKQRDGLSEFEQEFLRIIDEHGWHVMSVVMREGEEGIPWSYSTGIYYRFGHPEIIVFGETATLRLSMINAIGERVRDGERFEPGRGYAEIIGNFDCQFRPVDISHYKEYVGSSIWFYDRNPASFPLLQCFFPDMEGRFPWEPGCAQWAIDTQPLLDKFTSKKGT